MFSKCPNFSTCDDPAELAAVQNFSAENAEQPSFFSRWQCDPIGNNPLFRTAVSPRSQFEADALAASCLHEAIITNDEQSCVGCGVTVTQLAGTVLGISKAGANATAHALACLGVNTICAFSNTAQSCTVECPGGLNTYTIPAGTFTAPTLAAANLLATNAACANAAICGGGLFNTVQSCTIFCPQTNADITATVAAGIFFGLTQADADAAAQAVACALAFIACQAIPPLVDNEVEVCSQECNGETVTYTVPAGAFVSYDQASANLIAFQFCVQVLSAACQQDDLPPAPANVGNSAVSCSLTCTGGGTFSQTIQAGAFRLANRAAANAAALSYCNAHIYANSFCLNALAPGICVNEVYAAAVSTAGPGTPTLMGLTSGVLPPGLSLSGGLLAGIPNTPGVYSFTITAASAYGFASRDYTITVAEIVTVVLPDGDTSTPYAQAIVVNGFTDPVFTIVGGALPNPLQLHPATGVISGDAPTEDGPFAFVVSVQDSNAQCLQDYVLTVTAPTFCTDLVWAAPVIIPSTPAAGTGSATALECTFHVEATVPAFPAATTNQVVQIDGQQFYTGPAINLNLHLVISGMTGNMGNSDIEIQLDGNPLVSITNEDVDGTYDYLFTVPISVAANFTIQCLMIANSGAGAAGGVWDGTITIIP